MPAMDAMGMGGGMAAGGGPPTAEAPPAEAPPAEEQGPTSIFLSKEILGGKTVKEGDTGTVTIISVDPETGDAEANITIGGGGGEEMGYEEAFDRAIPPGPGTE